MLDKKQNRGQLFFHWEPKYKISKPLCAGFLRYGMHKKSLMNGQTVGWTNEGKIICPINFIRNWGHNQVIYSSLPIYSSSFKAPASIVFEIFCSQGKHAQIYKGPLLTKYFSEFTKKLIRSSTHHYQSIHQVSSL